MLLHYLLKFDLDFSKLADLHNQTSDFSLFARKSLKQYFDLLNVLVNLNLHLDPHLRYLCLNKDLLLCEPSPLISLHLLNDYRKSLLLLWHCSGMRLLQLQNVKIVALSLVLILPIQNLDLDFVSSVDFLDQLGIRCSRVLEFFETAS